MEKKGNWFSAVKKAFSPEPKEKNYKKKNKKNSCFCKQKRRDRTPPVETAPVPPHPLPPPQDVKLTEAENEQSKHAYSVALATAVAAEAAVAAAQAAAAEVVRLTTVSQFPGKSEAEVAAIKIQTAFRGYLARRALRALRGLVRLKSLIQGQSVKRQSTTTLRCMQTLARVQSQIHSRRIRMLEENRALQRQLQQKHERELEKFKASEEWDDSPQSKEQVEANLMSKQEAAMRRERALAYAYSHQKTWRNSSRSTNMTFMDPNNPHWGWSWLERWMAARPWEARSMMEKEPNDHTSVKSSTTSRSITGGEITKAYARRDLNADKPSPSSQKPSRPPSRQSPSTPPSKAASSSSVARKTKPASPRGSAGAQDDDSRSMLSMQSERYRRHSTAGSSVRDDESFASSSSVPSYMAPTQSAKARSRLQQSPLGVEKDGTPEKGSAGSAKKRLSFTASPTGPRRHSGGSTKEIGLHKENSENNGGST